MHSSRYFLRQSAYNPEPGNQSRAENLKIYLNFMKEYSLRKLSFESDRLKAFGGVMRDLEMSKFSVLQLWGVPFLNPGQSHNVEEARQSLVVGLLWHNTQFFWPGSSAPSRRSEFPSKSWVGWAGGVEPLVLPTTPFTSKLEEIYLELEPGNLMNLSSISYSSEISQHQSHYPRALQLDILVVSLQQLTICGFFRRGNYCCKFAGWQAYLELSSGPTIGNNVRDMFR